MTCEEFTRLIDHYLKEEIPEEKREAFETHYFKCDDCFSELKLRERLYSKEIPIVLKEKKPIQILILKPLLVLSSILIVVVSSLLVINNYKQAKFLYSISGIEPPSYILSETRNSIQNETFDNAMILYNKKRYDDALKLLKSIEDDSNNPQIIFFKAICCLQTGDPKAAIENFDIIIKNMNPSYYDEAIFYKGIALLRLNKKGDALLQFNHLATMFSPYSNRANAIINKIKNK